MAGGNMQRTAAIAVILGACLIALVGARPFAGGWNDGSRLATVESLVDHRTLAIDDSIFLDVPSPALAPYQDQTTRGTRGTWDKLRIGGHWYSDKSPVPALLLALFYQVLQWTTGLTASLHPEIFCYLMTVLSSGAAYVVAVTGMFYLATALQLPMRLRLGAIASFALGTLALVYVRSVNNHELLLGVTVALLACHVRLVRELPTRMSLLWLLGSLAGFAYTIDLGVGPPLWLGSLVLTGWRTRSARAFGVMLLATLPWLAAHHAVNYALGGTIKPANAVPEYLDWPDSPFTTNATGQWSHTSVARCASYALQLLVGKKGFLGHNLPLLLVFPTAAYLLRRRTPYLPEVLFCLTVSGGVWLVYVLGSTNYSGECVSIRWFVPLVGLGYFVLLVLLRQRPDFAADFWMLSIGGAALMASAWPEGPWRLGLLPAYWPIVGGTLLAWGAYRWRAAWKRQTAKRVALSMSAQTASFEGL